VSYGIETAADIDADHLDAIPGFGTGIISDLISWRDSVVRNFKYDSKKITRQAPELQATFLRYRQLQQTYEMKLTGNVEELRAVSERAQRELRQAEANIRAN
jgi:DNA-binding helix-hairpin-helix protein with protein kinase domain